jgi:hypothetical protein
MDKGNGEFLLSRDLREISKKHNASAVIVGTYGEGYERMYVSVRIVSPTDSRVLASYDLGIPMSWQEMGKLLQDS